MLLAVCSVYVSLLSRATQRRGEFDIRALSRHASNCSVCHLVGNYDNLAHTLNVLRTMRHHRRSTRVIIAGRRVKLPA